MMDSRPTYERGGGTRERGLVARSPRKCSATVPFVRWHAQVTLAHAHEANRRIVEQLNDQVDFLNRQLAVREEQLSKVGSGARNGKKKKRQKKKSTMRTNRPLEFH